MTAPLLKTLRMQVAGNRDETPTLRTDTLNHIKIIVIVLNFCNKLKMTSLIALSCLHPDEQIFFQLYSLMKAMLLSGSIIKGTRSKIMKKSVILFWLLNMTIWCKYVRRLELQKFLNCCAAHLPVRLDIEKKFLYILFLTWLSIIRACVLSRSAGHSGACTFAISPTM